MAAVKSLLKILLQITETGSGDLVTPRGVHEWPPASVQSQEFETGTSDNQMDRVWSDTRTATATPDDLDLRGVLTDIGGSVINFADVCIVGIRNRSTTDTLTIGAGSNPWITWLGTTGDQVKIPPGGILILAAPDDGFATVAGTGDILRIDPAAATIIYDIIIAGRSA